MKEEIRIIIADDNKAICKFIVDYLKQYNEIKILGIANTDEDEIQMIKEFKPDIVITDLMRNHMYTGLDIIRQYATRDDSPQFLVISADDKKDVIKDGLEVAGYIQIPFNYEVVEHELRKIKSKINN